MKYIILLLLLPCFVNGQGKRDYDTIPNPFGIKDKYQYPDIDKHFYDSATKRTACNTDNTICLTSDDPRVTVEYTGKDNQDTLLRAIDRRVEKLYTFPLNHYDTILSEAEVMPDGSYKIYSRWLNKVANPSVKRIWPTFNYHFIVYPNSNK